MKTVYHYKLTSVACAPDELVMSINKYSSKYMAKLLFNSEETHDSVHGHSILIDDENVPVTRDITELQNADLIHFHNKSVDINKPKVIQYHSPPHQSYVDLDFVGKKLVIAQYHATLYSDCNIVRNIIDYNSSEYNINNVYDKIRIGFSPSVKLSRGNRAHESKGWIETEEILTKLQNKYNIEIDIIHDVSLSECLKRKSLCNIIIDECVTNSYHRSGLEGLALGKMTICSLDTAVSNILKTVANSPTIPFENVWIENLESYLESIIIKNDISAIVNKGIESRTWIETYWNPKNIVAEFENIYDKILGI